MLLATWNVNSLRARFPRVLELIEKHRPDALLMQETKVDPGAFPRLELEAAGYLVADHSGGRWAGVAIAARAEHGLADVSAGLPGEPDVVEARWIEATVAGIRLASVYVPNGREVGSPTFTAKLRFLDAMAERASALAAGPAMIAGDMNVCPTDADVYDPAAFVGSTHVTPEERERLGRVLAGGFVDSFRRLHPDGPGFTWWDYRQGHFHRGLGLRIDLALVSAAIAPQLRSCGIDRDMRKGPKPSDHAPLLVELGAA
ncbi:MAG TPA: exodeoxyribonuclease III [Gaiellales bacterium]